MKHTEGKRDKDNMHTRERDPAWRSLNERNLVRERDGRTAVLVRRKQQRDREMQWFSEDLRFSENAHISHLWNSHGVI